ncbi:four helix bundle protein [Pedobacter changchengzhani]|uniref:Four helix bundle protein n=1 Tax=Pedobacter changchengzhani TaxID=2529274 RepID=A0A4R5MMY9_9SPHI|nr:four helix bundle protein [Pedobacter changchengzhani]TDG37082.1 four helix bundle protein [Pedobacter changchengzhani]
MQNYKDLLVWKKAHQLTLEVYKVVSTYPKEEIYSLVSQLKRASSSIATNIAEGTGRFSQKDLAHFLQIALGSSHEVEYLLLLSKDLGFINNDNYFQLEKNINEIKAMLISLIKKVRL